MLSHSRHQVFCPAAVRDTIISPEQESKSPIVTETVNAADTVPHTTMELVYDHYVWTSRSILRERTIGPARDCED